jgi:hypothetical protein
MPFMNSRERSGVGAGTDARREKRAPGQVTFLVRQLKFRQARAVAKKPRPNK